ncbi:MAG: TatD DNase family protein [Gammaproteobacteria bacterium]|jgi:TatD DNase family protein
MLKIAPNTMLKSALPLIDIGANLTNSRFDSDFEDVLSRAQAAGIRHIVITGTNIDESRKAIQIASKTPLLLSTTAGIHPHDAKQLNSESISHLRDLAKSDSVKAIGECGLDFNRNFSTQEQQIRAFEQQIELAIDLRLPLFLHERDAFKEQWEILSYHRDQLSGAVIHCFTGDKQQAFKYLDLDFYIGITGWICDERRGLHLQEFVGDIPLSRLMIESDSPYLTPRKKPKLKLTASGRNEPSTLPYILETIAKHSSLSEDVVARQTTKNAIDFFNLPVSLGFSSSQKN